jgi:hypothetical protein
MDMRLSIIRNRPGQKWKDPLMTYLEEHIFWISLELQGEVIHDMATLFAYIVDLKNEFQHCNSQYQKPFGFDAVYQRVECGTVTITVGDSQEQIIITEAQP